MYYDTVGVTSKEEEEYTEQNKNQTAVIARIIKDYFSDSPFISWDVYEIYNREYSKSPYGVPFSSVVRSINTLYKRNFIDHIGTKTGGPYKRKCKLWKYK